MSIEDIKRTELIQSERDVLKEDAARFQRMGAGSHLDEWMSYYPGLSIRRRLAMKLVHTNKPVGHHYAKAFALLMKEDGLDDKAVTSSFTAVLWLGDDPERVQILREMRDAMTTGERSRLNSPISARQRVEKTIKARETKGGEEKLKTSAAAQWKAKYTELAQEHAKLEARLAKADEGSLFDLKRDNADDIAVTIVNSVSENKAKAIAKGIGVWFKSKQKPAG